MRLLVRTIQRLAILGLGALSIWLIVYVFGWVDRGVPSVLALALTYGIGAYVILPYAVRMGLMVLRHKQLPRFTVTGDGLPGDPVNLALVGTFAELRSAFGSIGWTEADPLSLRSSWRMAKSFVLGQPYPTAPFSTLYLFGRGQDIGLQLPIGNSPRKRHHVRFWAKHLSETSSVDGGFWHSPGPPAQGERVLWVGAGTKDTGFSLTRLTFKITHATDSDTNAERDFIMEQLTGARAIGSVVFYAAGAEIAAGAVNHYAADGLVAVAPLRGSGKPPDA